MNETIYPTLTRFPLADQSYTEKIQSRIYQVLDFGTIEEDKQFNKIISILTQNPLPKGALLQSSLKFVLSHLPQKFRNNNINHTFANSPLPHDGAELEIIGEGHINKVFVISPDSQSPSIAIGISKNNFDTKDKAFAFANHQQQEHHLISSFFKHIPKVIPDEQYAVYQGPREKYNIMHFQNFVDGPIRDIFAIPEQELQTLIQTNPQFRDQLREFAQTCQEHADFFIKNQLDFIGSKNLAVIGDEGQEQLLFLDPHFRISHHTPDYEQTISQRIEYLNTLINN